MWRTMSMLVAIAGIWGWGSLARPAAAEESAARAEPTDLPPAATAPPLPAAAAVAQQIAAIEAELARLAPLAPFQQHLADYDRRLTEIKTRLRPEYAAGKSDQLELHVVGVYEGRRVGPGLHAADVRVSYAAAPVILSLCAYERVHWRVSVGPDVRLAQVILSGYEQQSVAGLPAGCPVANYSRPTTQEWVGFAYSRARTDSEERLGPLSQRLRELTNLPVATFQGAYQAPPEPIVVGPQGDEWRGERVRTDVERLAADLANEQRRRLWPELRGLRFSALWPSGGLHGGQATSYGQFSLAGPLLETHKPFPEKAGRVTQMAVDPRGPIHFAYNGEGLVGLDLAAGKGRYVELDENQEELSWVCGLAFDTRRRRVYLATLGGEGHLYAYEPDAQRWLAAKSLENVDLLSLTYLAEQDALFGLAFDPGGGGLRLYRFDAEGAVEAKLPVKGLPWGADGGFGGGLQLAAAEGRLVALVEFGSHQADSTQAYLIDPVSAEVVFSTRLGPPEQAPTAPATAPGAAAGKLAPLPPVAEQPAEQSAAIELPPPAVRRNLANGHCYERLRVNREVTWAEARDIAASRNYEGWTGYLATVTSAEENAFINEHWGEGRHKGHDSAWLGASDAEQEGEWKWVTGPEAGTVFWRGGSNGQAVGFHNWGRTGLLEPNNMKREELGENYCLWNWSFGQDGPCYWNDVTGEWTARCLLVEYSPADRAAAANREDPQPAPEPKPTP